jgi:hypothetical protein
MESNDKLTLTIHTCDKFSDLWDTNIQLLNQNWADRNIRTLLVTDKQTERCFDNVEIFAAGEGAEMSERLAAILPHINTKYVLVTLDDYFLTKKILTESILKLVSVMDKENIDYIRLFKIPNSKERLENYKTLYKIDLSGNYKVNLYPGIWRKSFLEKTVAIPLNAWQYEVSLTKTARECNAKCVMSKGKEFEILDVIRKGKILHKANRYLRKNNIYLDSREVIDYKTELRIFIFSMGKKILPNSLARRVKLFLIKKGYKFYSDVE